MAALAPGKARVQFNANREYIEELFETGETIKGVHTILIQEEKITMSYFQFRRLSSGEAALRTKFRPRSNESRLKQDAHNRQKEALLKKEIFTRHTGIIEADSNKSSVNTVMNDNNLKNLL